MINGLDAQVFHLWKYIDDTTLAEVVEKGEESVVQQSIDGLSFQVATDRFQLNEAKCKELHISFSRLEAVQLEAGEREPVRINVKELAGVSHAKILSITVSDHIKWDGLMAETL